MEPSPLQLLHSHFVGLSLVASEVMNDPSEERATYYPKLEAKDIRVEIKLSVLDGDPEHEEYMVAVGISNGEGMPGFPYRFAARMEGFFGLVSEEDLQVKKRLIVINGGSMLYGIIREQLLNLSLRHINGPLLLPSLDFRGLKEKQPTKSDAPEAKQPPEKKKKLSRTKKPT